MGNLVTKGVAKKEFESEIMTITITFSKAGDDVGYIMNEVRKQCEDFIAELDKIEISPESIRLKDEGLEKNYKCEKPLAERKVTIKTRIDIRLCTYLFSLIKKYGDSIRYKISYELTNEEDLRGKLLDLAVADSRRQADIIAASLGKTVIGVNSVNDKDYVRRNLAKSISLEDAPNPEIPEAFRSDTPLSDRAGLPTLTLEEEIEICWNMSD